MKNNRIGEINTNSYGTKMKIIEYENCHHLIVEFQDGNKYKTTTTYNSFIKGYVKNPYDASVCNKGYFGVGKYKDVENGVKSIQYVHWLSMLNRCYSEKVHKLSPTYIECTICDEWLNFQNFAKWFDVNYYLVNDEIMHLDKDIMCKGNKLYSPNTCVFVPKSINSLFVKNEARRGKYPIGVYKDKNKLRVFCRNFNDRKINLGTFSLYDIDIAFKTYKTYKEKIIKYVADLYKENIPIKLYKAMYAYKVEIND